MKQWLGFLATALLLSGCLMTRSQIEERNEKQTMQTQIQETKAAAGAQYADMEEQLREARGRIEVLENNIRLSKAADAEQQKIAAEDRRKTEERLKIYEETISKLERDMQALMAAREAQEKQAAQDEASAKAEAAKDKKKSTIDRADGLFDGKKWREAIVEYQKYRDANPSGKHYSDATYKIGVSFQELGLKDEAKAFYNEAVSKFPKSKAADKAKVRLKQLK